MTGSCCATYTYTWFELREKNHRLLPPETRADYNIIRPRNVRVTRNETALSVRRLEHVLLGTRKDRLIVSLYVYNMSVSKLSLGHKLLRVLGPLLRTSSIDFHWRCPPPAPAPRSLKNKYAFVVTPPNSILYQYRYVLSRRHTEKLFAALFKRITSRLRDRHAEPRCVLLFDFDLFCCDRNWVHLNRTSSPDTRPVVSPVPGDNMYTCSFRVVILLKSLWRPKF